MHSIVLARSTAPCSLRSREIRDLNLRILKWLNFLVAVLFMHAPLSAGTVATTSIYYFGSTGGTGELAESFTTGELVPTTVAGLQLAHAYTGGTVLEGGVSKSLNTVWIDTDVATSLLLKVITLPSEKWRNHATGLYYVQYAVPDMNAGTPGAGTYRPRGFAESSNYILDTVTAGKDLWALDSVQMQGVVFSQFVGGDNLIQIPLSCPGYKCGTMERGVLVNYWGWVQLSYGVNPANETGGEGT
jgi:hypothetical protein